MLGAILEIDLAEQAVRALAPLRCGEAHRRERELDVLQRSQRGDQVELLEDEPECAQP